MGDCDRLESPQIGSFRMQWAVSRDFPHNNATHHLRLVVGDNVSACSIPAAMSSAPAFADALVAQLPGLRRYAMALVGNGALADDLVQDCIERALGQQGQLRDRERMGAWLRRILYHLYIDEIRRGKRRGREQDITELADQLELSAPAPDN